MQNNFYFTTDDDFPGDPHGRQDRCHRHGRRQHPHGGRGGGRGQGRGRGGRARRGDLRNIILTFLADKPMHGYELMTLIAERTEQHWAPSAGAIYPQLSQLEDEGLITMEATDGRKVAHLTDSGRIEAEGHAAERDRILAAYSTPWEGRPERKGDGPGNPEVRAAFKRLGGVVRSTDPAQAEKVRDILDRAADDIRGL